jgi:two-component system phosphate regulon sensor histidine kinase PhoR
MMSNLNFITQVMGNVAAKLQKQEAYSFYDKYNHYKDSTGKICKKMIY